MAREFETPRVPSHVRQLLSRRTMLKAGAIGVAGALGDALPARAAGTAAPKAVIFLFLTGGLGQHDSFDMKPEGPTDFRGEFRPIATRTPGIQICEHMPLLAERSQHWSLVRTISHADNDHTSATYRVLTGKSDLPRNYRAMLPQSVDLPCMTAIGGAVTQSRGNLPRAVVLPEKIYHSNSGTFSGQFAGLLGQQNEPWMIEATDKPHAYHSYSGAFPEYLFDLHKGELSDKREWRFAVQNLTLPEGVFDERFGGRRAMLDVIEAQQQHLDAMGSSGKYDRARQSAMSLMVDPKVRAAVDVRNADPKTLARYGNNSFGWSLLMARRLIEVGVNIVQVNLGNFGSWDLHGNNFHCLKEYLFPPTDRAVSGLIDDLQESGLFDRTLVVMAGEFGRTPRISHIAQNIYKYPGRDHWGPVQTAWFAGGGVRGGTVIGATDNAGAYPINDPYKPENLAATIYRGLGIPELATWTDVTGRPHSVYDAQPIERLFMG